MLRLPASSPSFQFEASSLIIYANVRFAKSLKWSAFFKLWINEVPKT
jgi:hypothetical protein